MAAGFSAGKKFFSRCGYGAIFAALPGADRDAHEETERLSGEVNAIIHKVVPSSELNGILDNIGIPNSSINLSYNTSGVIGAGRLGCHGFAQTGPRGDGNLYPQIARGTGANISGGDVLLFAGGYCEPDAEFQPARAAMTSRSQADN